MILCTRSCYVQKTYTYLSPSLGLTYVACMSSDFSNLALYFSSCCLSKYLQRQQHTHTHTVATESALLASQRINSQDEFSFRYFRPASLLLCLLLHVCVCVCVCIAHAFSTFSIVCLHNIWQQDVAPANTCVRCA